ncbi:MAG: OmpA family protein [Tannerellaceae bacterium]|nr:OmpA family protein [Tannerellaceae bacterium]
MKNVGLVGVILLCLALVFSGCGASKTVKGAGIGAGAGGVVGAGVGAIAGNAALGGVLGAVVGGTAGALIGKKMEKQRDEIVQNIPDADVEVVNDGEALKVTFDSGILFSTNSSTLSESSKSALNRFATTLNNNPDTDIRIIGYTDATGQDAYNQTLSEKRAQSVYTYLVNDGVSSNRMEFSGRGENDPVAPNNTAEGRAKNRRVEILVEANDAMKRAAQEGKLD